MELLNRMQQDWWQHFFTGLALEFWREINPPEQTLAEAELIRQVLQLPPHAAVLDVPCGHGRFCLALAAMGFRLTGVDLCAEELDAARTQAKRQHLAVDWEHRDMRDLPWHDWFDAAICVGNSFGYMEDDANAAFLAAVCRALKPGARFLLEYPLLAESFLHRFQEKMWFEVGDLISLVKHRHDPVASRVHSSYTFIRSGQVQTCEGSHRIYTFRELKDLLHRVGFSEVQGFGSLYRDPLKLGAARPYLLCQKAPAA